MQRQSTFVDNKTQYCPDINSSQLDPEIQSNRNLNPSKLFCRYGESDSKVCMVRKRPSMAHTILQKNEGGQLTPLNGKTY